MTKGNIQYFADTLLLEKIAVIDYALIKNADIKDQIKSMLGGIFTSIKDDVSAKVQDKGVLATLGEYLTSGAVVRLLGPWGAVIEMFAGFFGFNIGDFVGSIFSFIKNKISNNEPVNLNDINQEGKSLAGITSEASSDMLYLLRKAEYEGRITKISATKGNGVLSDFFTEIMNSNKSTSRKKSSIGSIIAGIIMWVVKSIVIGAGITEASSVVKKMITTKDDSNSSGSNSESSESGGGETENANYQTGNPHPVKVNLPPTIQNSFSSSGDGNQYHINDGSSVWVVPLVNQSVEKTLTYWANSIYPELKGHESELNQLSSFNNMASALKAGLEENHPDYLTIPQGLHSRKDIVDRFVGALNLKDYK